MIKRTICFVLLMLLLTAPSFAEENDLKVLFDFAEWLAERINQPDPYMWIFEKEADARIEEIPEIAQMLRDLGIEDVTEEVEEEYTESVQMYIDLMAEYGFEYEISREQMILGLLFTAGSKNDTRSVYAFDAEIYDVDTMYRDFLHGVERISGGELAFDRINEDLSGVDWETGDGKRMVAFDYRDKTFAFEAIAQQDWFDMNMLSFLHDAVGVNESGKELYFVLDGAQGVILFYQTSQWAKSFTRITGCPLFTSLE